MLCDHRAWTRMDEFLFENLKFPTPGNRTLHIDPEVLEVWKPESFDLNSRQGVDESWEAQEMFMYRWLNRNLTRTKNGIGRTVLNISQVMLRKVDSKLWVI